MKTTSRSGPNSQRCAAEDVAGGQPGGEPFGNRQQADDHQDDTKAHHPGSEPDVETNAPGCGEPDLRHEQAEPGNHYRRMDVDDRWLVNRSGDQRTEVGSPESDDGQDSADEDSRKEDASSRWAVSYGRARRHADRNRGDRHQFSLLTS